MRLSFQDPSTIIMEGVIDLHNYIMFYLIVVVVLVSWMLYDIVMEYGLHMYVGVNSVEKMLDSRRNSLKLNQVVHGKAIEIIWTITPSIVLVLIAIPSFSLLYSMDELVEPVLSLKVIGHQWYWSYEYSDFDNGNVMFDSYMVPEDELKEGEFRLLEVDRKVWLPVNVPVRVLITSVDVLHCWAVPSMGVKMDAVPGRLNQVSIFLKREGLFYGQCSELCGVQHGFMPIVVKGVSIPLFNKWVDFNLEE